MYLRMRVGRETEKLGALLRATNELLNIGFKTFLVERRAYAKSGKKKLLLRPGDIVFEEPSWDSRGLLTRVASKLGLELEEIQAAELSTSPLRYPTIGVYSGFGVETRSLRAVVETLSLIGLFKLAFMTSGSLPSALEGVDVLIVPNGDCSLIVEGLGEVGAGSIRRFVESGGSFIGISESALVVLKQVDSTVPRSEEYSRPASLLSLVEGKVVSDIIEVPSAAFWNYRTLEGVMRLSPISGEVVVRSKGSAPFLLRVKEVRAWLDAPLFSVSKRSFEIAKVKSISPNADLGADCELVKNMISQASAVAFVPYSLGRLFLFSPDVSRQGFLESHLWLGGAILFSSKKVLEGQMQVYREPTKSESSQICLAELVTRSHDLDNQARSLYRVLEVIAPLSVERCSKQVRDKVFDLLDSLDNITTLLDEFRVDLIRLFEGSQILAEAVDRIAANQNLLSRDRLRLEFLNQNLSRTLQEASRLNESSCRAIVALLSLSINLEKTLLETSKELLKSSEEPLDVKILDVIYGISGDGPMYAPWYDGRSGRPETRIANPNNFGFISPLLSMVVGYKRVSSALNMLRLFMSS